MSMTPREIVHELNRHIVGQDDAKRAVAIALRNRWRRMQLSADLRNEVTPKNILMIGPTGVGKTEIARRLAKLVDAPFVKVEATKFTEVGYVGRDVESIIRDLVNVSIRNVKESHMEQVLDKAETNARQRLIDLLAPGPGQGKKLKTPFDYLFQNNKPSEETTKEETNAEEEGMLQKRERMTAALDRGDLEETMVEVEVEDS